MVSSSDNCTRMCFFFIWILRPVKVISLILNRVNRKVGRKREIPDKNHLTTRKHSSGPVWYSRSTLFADLHHTDASISSVSFRHFQLINVTQRLCFRPSVSTQMILCYALHVSCYSFRSLKLGHGIVPVYIQNYWPVQWFAQMMGMMQQNYLITARPAESRATEGRLSECALKSPCPSICLSVRGHWSVVV